MKIPDFKFEAATLKLKVAWRQMVGEENAG